MSSPARLLRALWLSLALVLPGAAAVEAQAYGYLVGRVVDAVSGAPLEGAQVSIVGTELRAVTDARGHFLLEGVPSGENTLRTALEGYTSVVEPVRLSATEVGSLQIRLTPVAAVLEDLLVLAGREGSGSGSATVDATSQVEESRSALDLLQDVPGVLVSREPGQVGAGASIRVRGVRSLQGSTSPALYVDGVRVDDSAGGSEISRVLDQIPAETVSRIRVLRGPAETERYPFAANGVILVETRRGGAPRR